MSAVWKLVIKIVLLLLMVASIVVMAFALKKQAEEKRRLRANYEAEISGDRSRQQTIDVREFKEYFEREMQELKEHGIPARNVEHIIEVSYVYRDTTIYRDTLVYVYDTVRSSKRADFNVETNCFGIKGRVVGDTLEISDFSANDDVMVALYREKRKCLFQKQRVKAIAISGCTGDTLAIKRNLKIER